MLRIDIRTALLSSLVAASSATAAAAPPPVEYFMRHAAYSDARISPDGKHLAITVDRGDQDVLTVLRMSDMGIVKVNVLPDEKSVADFQWIGDERLLFTAVRKVGGFAQPSWTGEWYAVNADGSQPEPVIFYGTRGASERGKTVGAASFSFLDPLENDPRNALMVQSYPRSQEGAGTQLVRVDTVSGARKELVRAPRENCELTVDQTKEARWAVCYDDEDESGRFDTTSELWRRAADGGWAKVDTGRDEINVVRVADTGTVYAERATPDGAPQAFGTIDPATGAFTELFRDPVAEPEAVVWSPVDGEAIAVASFAGAPRLQIVAPDHADAAVYESLASAFPGQFVTFGSATRDGSKVIVSVASDRNPGELYLYDRGTGQARFLMKRREWVDPSTAATVRPFRFKARDGLTLHGYLTLPHGVKDPKGLPLIVNPHGGPMGPRDHWFYNPETQLLASRGFAVLQVNYRGSGGFGKAFRDKAYGSWGGPLMDDIVDATRWAITEGIADEDRVCIYGASFGGYASMMAPARAPDLYACAFGYVGMYDAQIQFRRSDTGDRSSGIRYLQRAFGETRAEQDAMSPVTHAAKLDLPIFLAAGARDPRCPPEHTEKMAAALTAAGNPPKGVIIQSGEMHGFYDVANRVNLYTQMLGFFADHIGGTVDVGEVEPADAP